MATGGMMPAYKPIEERFWEKVDVRGTDECWMWLGAVTNHPNGKRGRIRLSRQRKTENAYRVAYELIYGDIPNGKIICHSCGNSLCCNPNHLYAGTYYTNNIDRIRHGRQAGGARKGENHHGAILTREKRDEIYRRVLNGERGCDLAKEFGVSRSCISDIKKGRSWNGG